MQVEVGLDPKPGQRIHELEVSDDIMDDLIIEIFNQIESHPCSRTK